MKKILCFIAMFFMPFLAYALLTPGYVPVDKTTGPPPQIQNGSIYDTGNSSGPGNVGIATVNPQFSLDVNNKFGNALIGTSGDSTLELSADNLYINNISPGNSAGMVQTLNNVLDNGRGSQQIAGSVGINLGNNLNTGVGILYVYDNNDNVAFNVNEDNVGIGSLNPVQALDVVGTVRTLNLTVSSQSPTPGYVLTASDSAGDTTWSPASGVSGWTISGLNIYDSQSGNVGIGSTNPGQKLDVHGTIKANQFVEVGLPESTGGATYACFTTTGQLISQLAPC